MRRFLTFFALASLGLWCLLQMRARGDAGWQKLDNGLEMRTIQQRAGMSVITITAIRAPASRVHIGSGGLWRAPEWAAKTGALAVVNGGYFNDQAQPLGLRVSDGKRTNPIYARANWGVFAIRDGRAFIAHTRDYKPSPNTRQAMQCGPRLAVDGKTTDLKQQWARRSGVGVDARGRVVVAVSDGALSFDDWAKLWVDEGAMNCPNALNLDGGGSTQMSVKSKNHPIEIHGAWPIPDVVMIK